MALSREEILRQRRGRFDDAMAPIRATTYDAPSPMAFYPEQEAYSRSDLPKNWDFYMDWYEKTHPRSQPLGMHERDRGPDKPAEPYPMTDAGTFYRSKAREQWMKDRNAGFIVKRPMISEMGRNYGETFIDTRTDKESLPPQAYVAPSGEPTMSATPEGMVYDYPRAGPYFADMRTRQMDEITEAKKARQAKIDAAERWKAQARGQQATTLQGSGTPTFSASGAPEVTIQDTLATFQKTGGDVSKMGAKSEAKPEGVPMPKDYMEKAKMPPRYLAPLPREQETDYFQAGRKAGYAQKSSVRQYDVPSLQPVYGGKTLGELATAPLERYGRGLAQMSPAAISGFKKASMGNIGGISVDEAADMIKYVPEYGISVVSGIPALFEQVLASGDYAVNRILSRFIDPKRLETWVDDIVFGRGQRAAQQNLPPGIDAFGASGAVGGSVLGRGGVGAPVVGAGQVGGQYAGGAGAVGGETGGAIPMGSGSSMYQLNPEERPNAWRPKSRAARPEEYEKPNRRKSKAKKGKK